MRNVADLLPQARNAVNLIRHALAEHRKLTDGESTAARSDSFKVVDTLGGLESDGYLFRFALEQASLRARGGNCILRLAARGLVPRRALVKFESANENRGRAKRFFFAITGGKARCPSASVINPDL